MKLAQLQFGAGNVGISLLLLERAEQTGSHKAAVQNLLGLTYNQLGDPQEAAGAFKEAVTADPSDTHAHLNFAAHCAAYGQLDRAKVEVLKTGNLLNEPRGPTDHPGVSLLGELAAEKKPGRVVH